MLSFTIKCVSILATLWMINCGEHTKSYQIYEEQVPWLTAYQKCIADGMQLATISNGEENDLIQRVIAKSSSKIFWTSGVREDEENDFLWWNSVPVSYTKWMPSEPDNFGNYENCISIHRGKGEWSDSNCYMKYGFICESVAHSSHKSRLSTNNHPSLNSKDDGVHTYTTYSQKESWMDAHRRCLSENSHLVAIAAEHDNKMVSEQLQQSILSDDTNTLYWTSGIQGAGQKDFYWWNTDPVFYSNWDRSGLAKTSDKQSCVAIDSQGKWFVEDCEKQLGFICENSLVSISSRSDLALEKYESYYRKWYTLNPNRSNRTVAELACASSQGHLLSVIGDKELRNILNSILKKALYSGRMKYYTSGVAASKKLTYEWWSNELIPPPAAWAKGQPKTGDCVALNYLNALETSDCKEQLQSICEYFEVTEPVTPELIERDCCKSVKNQNKVYHVFHEELEWEAAAEKCHDNNMHLASVRSFEEDLVLKEKIMFSPQYELRDTFWLGGRRVGNYGRFEWQHNGEPLTYSAWEAEQPNFYEGKEVCFNTVMHSGWNDIACTATSKYICEEILSDTPDDSDPDCFATLKNRFEELYNSVVEKLKDLEKYQNKC